MYEVETTNEATVAKSGGKTGIAVAADGTIITQ